VDLAGLLLPFLPAPLTQAQLAALAAYLELLLHWNARINLTAVRRPEEIVTRHFGESLFAASQLLTPDSHLHALDVGSGAGFPGLPLKIYAPDIRLTLIESQNKKATFLKEVVRALALPNVAIFAGRAEACTERADLVTLRAVERFEAVLPVAASLLRAGQPARLALLIGAPQAERARAVLPRLTWGAPWPIPQSSARVLMVGSSKQEAASKKQQAISN
jgi:16S rRNA (guanine527-N7)-methyltransferase